jgi:hypothetical protein
MVDQGLQAQTGFLFGERVYLRPLAREDLSHIREWANNPNIRRLTGEITPMSQVGDFYERACRGMGTTAATSTMTLA